MRPPLLEVPRRILLCRTDRLGDVILALPCALLLKRIYPDCRISLLVQSYTAPLPQMLPAVDDVIEVEPKETVVNLAGVLREREFDAAIALYPELRTARALARADIPFRAGIAYRWYSRLFNYRHPEHRKHNLKHEVEYNLALTYGAFSREGRWEDFLPPKSIFPLPLELPQVAVQQVSDLWAGLKCESDVVVVLHSGGSGSAHRWPQDNFCDLAQHLAQGKGWRLVITGAANEAELCSKVAEAAGEKGANLCGRLNLPELAAVLKKCSLLVTNSTGPLHLGRAVGANVLGLYPSVPAMSPTRWGPYAWPDHVIAAAAGKDMSSVRVDQVHRRVLELLR